MPLLSIIVPVYNTDSYLPKCIDSILTQCFWDFELLLIDDGSTDESGAVCDKYAETDSRICAFHKENGGVSSARNLGLKCAKGDWICFVDSDDELFRDGLEILSAGISDKVDMVWGGYEIFNEKRERTYAESERSSYALSNEEGMEMLFSPKCYRYLGYACAKLFRRTVISSSRIFF